MANYIATTRSNYFRVKDADAFESWCHRLSLEFWTCDCKENPGEIFHAITSDTGGSGWPSSDPETDADIEFTAELASHLDARDVAILFEVGSEKLRYVIGEAVAVTADGQVVSLGLNDIYDRAREVFGPDPTITEASY